MEIFIFITPIVCSIATLVLVGAIVFSEKFRRDILGGEGEARLFGILTVKGTAVLVLCGLFLGGLLWSTGRVLKSRSRPVMLSNDTISNLSIPELYPFNENGEPEEFVFTVMDTAVIQFMKADTTYHRTLRQHQLDDKQKKLYIKTQKGYDLGYLNLNDQELVTDLKKLPAFSELSADRALDLGTYYSIYHKEQGFGKAAVEHLTKVLENEESSWTQKEKATNALYKVLVYIDNPEDFRLLIKNLTDLIVRPSKYYEIAETYIQCYKKTGTDRDKKYTGALRNYMIFLTEDRLIKDKDQAKRLKEVKANMKFFVNSLTNIQYIQQNKTKIIRDIDTLNRNGLKIHYENIAEPEIDSLK